MALSGSEIHLIRFARRRPLPSKAVEGAFLVGYKLERGNELSSEDRQKLNELLTWFKKNLAVPPRFNRTKSKGYYRRTNTGISWFKADAKDHLDRMRELVAILERNGVPIEALTTAHPGFVIYEDDHQIVAEPFREKRRPDLELLGRTGR